MATSGKGEAVAEGDLIKDVKDDDDLDMSTIGKPVSSLAKPSGAAAAAAAVQQPTTPDQADGPPAKSKASKSGKSGTSKANENIWSQLDKEIEDVSEDDLDNLTPEKIAAEAPGSPTKDGKADADKPKETKRGMMPGGLSGGASLGANAPLKEGPKDHSYDIVDGEAKARVYDTPELRAAFLHYCKSSIKVSEMHLVHEGPFMAAQQFVQLCKDYKLLEPEGKLSFVMVGIIYTTSKSDDDEGLAFGQFLDSMVSLAFECECNVAGTIQAEWDKKDVLGKNNVVAQQQQARRVRPTNLRALSTAGTDGDQSGALTPGTHGSVTPGGASTPGGGAGDPGALLQRSASRFHELVDQEGGAPVVRRKDPKKRFQGVETMTHSSVLDKVNEVSKIRSKATSRATSVINSRVASRMVSRLPSRRASEYGSEEEDEEDDFFDKEGLPVASGGAPLSPSHKLAAASAGKPGKPPAVPPAAGAAYTISPSFLSTHVHAALQGYDGYEEDDPNGQRSSVPNVQGPNGETVSPLFAVASNIPQSPGAARARSSLTGAAPTGGGLRPTTASNRGRMGSVSTASPGGPSSAETGIKTLPKDVVNKGFGEEGGAAAAATPAADEEQRASVEGGTPSKAKPPTHPGVVAAQQQQQQGAGGRGARVSSGGGSAGGEGALPTKSSLKSSLRDSGNKGLNKTSSSEGGAFGSPAGSFRARFSDAGDPAAAAAAAAAPAQAPAEPPVEQVLLAPGLSKQVNTQLWSQWTAQGGHGVPPKEWVDANVTKYTDGSAAAGATSLNNVSRSINTQGGAVSITAARQIKGAVAAASAAATGRRDSATGEGHPAGGDRQLSPYELQLAKLEAKYKRGGGGAAAAPAAAVAAEGVASRDQSPSRAGSARQSQSGSQPIWRPAGKDGPLSGSGKIKVDPNIARVASGRGGRASSSGGVGDSALSPTSPAAAPVAGDPALVLKSMLLNAAATASESGAALAELPDSPTDHLHHLPTGEMLSPAKGRIARNAAANAVAAAGGRPPVAISEDQLAMMASFGQGVVGNAAVEAAAAAADALEEERLLKQQQQQEAEASVAAGGAGGEEGKFSFAQKRRAEMEAKLAQIEQRLGGKAGELAPKPKPPSGPPPGAGATGSPRSSAATLAAVRPKPPSAAVAQ